MDIRLDCDALLAPLTASAPAGENVEFTLEYDEIQRSRQSEPEYLSQGEWTTELKKADWPRVRSQCEALLLHTGKDLQVACWLFEACYQIAGLQGMCEGARFLTAWTQMYWDSGWPLLSEDDEGSRRQNIMDKSAAALKDFLLQFPLFGVPESAFSAWKQAENEEATPGGETLPEARLYQAIVYSAWVETLTPGVLCDTMDELSQCLDALTLLAQTLGSCDGLTGAPFSAVLALITTIREALAGVWHTRFPDAEAGPEPEDGNGQGAVGLARGREEMNRTSAVEQLKALARYFRQTEPSSPVPFLIERAVRWTGMSALDWLDDITQDNNNLDQVYFVLKGKQDRYED
ncbi:type VI secretion system protein TssA [Salmonella enterica]|nr:type VI secretion system protein TssA [Salmonella enterica]